MERRPVIPRVSLVGVALLLVACGPRVPEWHQETGHRWRELRVPRRGADGFRRLAPGATGIVFTNQVTEDQILENEHVLNGSGVAIGDVDGDGLADIYLARLHGPNALYRNLGNWTFEDIAGPAGVALPDRFSTGTALADVDGDGDLDLLVTSLGGPNALFLNDGTGTFTERRDAGLISQRGSTTMALADTDGDGDLDLYVANYKVKSVRDVYPPEARAFDQVVQRVGERYVVKPEFRAHYGLTMQRNRLMRFEYGEPDHYYLNDGTGRFREAAFEAPPDWSLAARFFDLDGDRDPDLFIANDFESPDLLWINDGAGRFRQADALSLRTTSQSSMAVDFSDIDRDGDVDVFEVDMLDLHSGRRKMHTPPVAPDQVGVGDVASRVQQPRNTLFLNREDGSFAEIAQFAGVHASGWSWSTVFLDVDLDGYEDILIATGHAYDFLDSDTQTRLQTSRVDVDWRRTRLLFPRLDLPNVAFRNRGDLTFDTISGRWGLGLEADVSHGMATGDLDGDGDLDLVINRLGQPVAVYRNQAARPRIAVRLRGRSPNTAGVGAQIRVLGGPVESQYKEVTAGGLYLSSAEPLYTFATGDARELTITVDWRNGTQSTIRGATPNRLYEIDEPPAGSRSAGATPPPATEAVFADVSGMLNHRHTEQEFDDFGRQPLLLHRLSELGPGITWSDVDRDGDEDLLIASGRGGRLAWYRNDRGRLTAAPLAMPPTPLDQTSVLVMPLGSGGSALLVGQMNYEAASPAAALAADAVMRVELGRGAPRLSGAVPGVESATGPLALADYDGDGDLDLFVGGRVVTARYPTQASSRLFTQDGGRFVLDSVNGEVLARIGMVSAAVFADLDGDGDQDLALALDWGPITVLINDGGRFSNRTDRYGLDRTLGRWNGITTGDFDGDGRQDLVATSWGRNSRLRPDRTHPLFLYYGDFDDNGRMDLLEGQYDPRLKAIAPLRGYLRVTQGIPEVRRRIRTFAAYADASMQEVLGPAAARATVLQANTADHLLLLNRDSTFTAIPLPAEAQLAPAFYAGVADFNGDGHEDLFLAQNFSGTEIGASRYDAGRGLWLEGDGTGRLTPVDGAVTGIKVYGDQRGAALADWDADGRVDLVVSQNGNQTRLFQNRGAAPGLRVRLVGPPANPDAFGATIRLVYGDQRGPARAVKAGSGYWSQDGPVQVLGLREQPTALWVRWPAGTDTTLAVPPGARDLTATWR